MWRACAPKAIPPLDEAGSAAYKAGMMTAVARMLRPARVGLGSSGSSRSSRRCFASSAAAAPAKGTGRAMMEGMVVVELANVLAGPSVCQFLAELGADDIIVENSSTNGDVTRTWKLAAETGELSHY